MAPVLAPLFVALVVAAIAGWVLVDARRWQQAGTPVVLQAGAFRIATPEAWAVACLLVFVLFAPAYAAARRS